MDRNGFARIGWAFAAWVLDAAASGAVWFGGLNIDMAKRLRALARTAHEKAES